MTTPIGKPPLHPDPSAEANNLSAEVLEYFKITILGTPVPIIDEHGNVTWAYKFEDKFYFPTNEEQQK